MAGFAGGWLGVGIDEYGNFATDADGRYLPAGANRQRDAVAVRGPSNSFYTAAPANRSDNGYPYLAGSVDLSPNLDSSTGANAGGGPGDLYRITIDSRVPGEQWVQVERSTNNGTSYSTPVGYFNSDGGADFCFGYGRDLAVHSG